MVTMCDNSFAMYSLADPSSVKKIAAPARSVKALATHASSSGEFIAAGGSGGWIAVYCVDDELLHSAADAQARRQTSTGPEQVVALEFDEDGRRLFVARTNCSIQVRASACSVPIEVPTILFIINAMVL